MNKIYRFHPAVPFSDLFNGCQMDGDPVVSFLTVFAHGGDAFMQIHLLDNSGEFDSYKDMHYGTIWIHHEQAA